MLRGVSVNDTSFVRLFQGATKVDRSEYEKKIPKMTEQFGTVYRAIHAS